MRTTSLTNEVEVSWSGLGAYAGALRRLTRVPSNDEFRAADLLQAGRLGGRPGESTTRPS